MSEVPERFANLNKESRKLIALLSRNVHCLYFTAPGREGSGMVEGMAKDHEPRGRSDL